MFFDAETLQQVMAAEGRDGFDSVNAKVMPAANGLAMIAGDPADVSLDHAASIDVSDRVMGMGDPAAWLEAKEREALRELRSEES
jgi:ribosomal protein S5